MTRPGASPRPAVAGNRALGAGRTLLAGLLLVVLAEAALFAGAIFGGETFRERDLAFLHRPAKSLVAPLWRASAGLPLWNPFYASGQPYAANPAHATFHPLTLLFLGLPFEAAFRAQVLVSPLVGGLSAFALARALGRSRAASVLGAVGWGFGGYLVSCTNLLPILFAASVAPAVLAFAVRCAREGRSRDVVGLSVSVALVAAAGEPSTLLMLPLLVAAALAAGPRRASPLRSALASPRALLLGAALGAGLSAASLLPGFHHAAKTIRAGGLPDRLAGEWSLPPARLLELASPRALGHVDEEDGAWYWGGGLYPGTRFPLFYSLYPGLCVTLLALVAAVRGWRRLWPWFAVSGLGLLLALGANAPFWPLARGIPLLSGIRYPEKFVLLLALPLLVLATYGFDWTLGSRARPLRALAAGLGLAASLGLCAAAVISWADGRGTPPWAELGVAPHLAARFGEVAARDALRVAGVAASCLLALAVFRRSRSWGRLALVAVTAADLAHVGRSLVPSEPVAEAAAAPPFLRPLVGRPLAGPLFHLAADDAGRGLARVLACPPIPVQWGIALTLEEDFELVALEWTERSRRLFWSAVERKPEAMPALLSRRGVAAVVKLRPGVHVAGGLLRMPTGTTSPAELALPASPRLPVFAAKRVAWYPEPDGWVDVVLGLGSEAADTVCLEAGDGTGLPDRPSTADVRDLRTAPGAVRFEVAVPGPLPAVLAVNQTWDEGWAATVDGERVDVLRADVALSALVVPPGHHRVELRYRDAWVVGGLAVSGLSLAALAGVAALGLARRKGPDSTGRLTRP